MHKRQRDIGRGGKEREKETERQIGKQPKTERDRKKLKSGGEFWKS